MINWTLKKAIIDRFRTQAEFSQKIEKPEPVISLVIRGRKRLSEAEQEKWACLLNCTAQELFGSIALQ